MPRGRRAGQRTKGFTVLELLIVLAIIALATAGVALSLRDPNLGLLEQNAERLAAQLEGVRAWSRSSKVAVIWRATDTGYRFDGLPRQHPWATQNWDLPTSADAAPSLIRARPTSLVLGPEPLLPEQTLTLQLLDFSLLIHSDGLRPFGIEPADSTNTALSPRPT